MPIIAYYNVSKSQRGSPNKHQRGKYSRTHTHTRSSMNGDIHKTGQTDGVIKIQIDRKRNSKMHKREEDIEKATGSDRRRHLQLSSCQSSVGWHTTLMP